MPTMARKIHEAIQPVPEIIPWPEGKMRAFLDDLEAGQAIGTPDVLFAKIADEQVEEWKLVVCRCFAEASPLCRAVPEASWCLISHIKEERHHRRHEIGIRRHYAPP